MLGTTGVKRAQATPDVPTIAEQGVPGYEADSWTGVLLPRGTPPEIVAQLQAEVVRITNLPETKERLTAAGFETVGGASDAFAALIKNDLARLGKVIRDANIRAE
jgi:tripartite-type tricarboxylate transporter receptor subunit TctC